LTKNLVHKLRLVIERDQSEMLIFLRKLVEFESPTLEPDSQVEILSFLGQELEALGFSAKHISGKQSGGFLVAESLDATADQGQQMLVGHCDTVWPRGTLKTMPFIINDNIARGPGIYDMKAGVAQIVFAFRAIRETGQSPSVTPLIIINSDEETGSHESRSTIKGMAQRVERAYILEPALGLTGKLKTERKGVGRYKVVVTGKAAHAGLAPEKGRSAVLEMSHVIQKLFSLNDPDRGISVNVGKIEGGLHPNVIAPRSSAEIDVRIPTAEDAVLIQQSIFNLQPTTPGTRIEASGQINRPPLEKTLANNRLWNLARNMGQLLDLNLEDGLAGGGSDGNTTSQYTATLDGLGAVGDGAHAEHEFIYIDKMVERTILLALLIMAPSVK
jgi:glutamate carboxypeptidase